MVKRSHTLKIIQEKTNLPPKNGCFERLKKTPLKLKKTPIIAFTNPPYLCNVERNKGSD